MNFYSIEQLRNRFKYGIEQLAEDEFIGSDGLPYCKKCKNPRYYEHNGEVMRNICDCQEEERRQIRENLKAEQRLFNFNERKKLSLLGERYKNLMFDNAIITEANAKIYDSAKNYVKNADTVLKNNIGLYIYGDNSTGKTYLTACMCNELIWKGFTCIYTNFSMILNEITGFYKKADEYELISSVKNYDFLFFDDFGKEFIGREYNPKTYKWAEEKLFEILNYRYNTKRPTIFSSNYTISDLADILNLDKAIVERVNEMATRTLKLQGDDFRETERARRAEIAKSMGI